MTGQQTPPPIDGAPERRAQPPITREELEALHKRLDKGSDRMKRIEGDLSHVKDDVSAVKAEVSENTTLTREIRDVMTAARVGFKVLGGLGSAAKWAGKLAVAGAAIYTLGYMVFHGGMPPPTK